MSFADCTVNHVKEIIERRITILDSLNRGEPMEK